MKFENQVVIVTGASSGIGEGVAKRFLAEGAKVVGCGIEEKMNIQDPNAIYVQANLTEYAAAEKVVAKAVEAFGKVDKLICCAGVTFIGSLESTSPESFSREFQINVNGVFHMCKAAVPELKKQPGAAIVNIASDLGLAPISERIGYCPSKAAVIMLTKCIALEQAPAIRANCIMPGLVRTPMIEARFTEAPDPEAVEREMAAIYPMARIGKIEDMTNAIVYLASDDASFVTGEVLGVCGGTTALHI